MTDERDKSLLDKLIGRFKRATGELTEDERLKREGSEDKNRGQAREELADAKEDVGEKAAEVERRKN